VVGDATEAEVLAVAERLMLPEDVPADATLGDLPDLVAPDKAIPTVHFPNDATPVPGMTGTPVFGPDQPGYIPAANATPMTGASTEAGAGATAPPVATTGRPAAGPAAATPTGDGG